MEERVTQPPVPAAEPPRAALPRFRSHKVVEAAKIVGVTPDGPVGDMSKVVLHLDMPGPNGETGTIDVVVTPSWLQRAENGAGRDPQAVTIIGGYYVRYEDGFESWSPAAAFEAGYVELRSPLPYDRIPRRFIETHQVNAANKELAISVQDDPGSGGANHLYEITGFRSGSNPSDPWVARHGEEAHYSTLLFQNVPIGEVGVNGITHEALLAVIKDRLECFQAGPFACDENKAALTHIDYAIRFLQQRTQRRMQAGTEGTHQGG